MSAHPTPGQEQLPLGDGDSAAGAAAHAFASHALPPEPGVWDELRGPGGVLRPAWQRFVAQVPVPAGGVSMAEDLDRRVAQVEQRIRLDGVTHNVFAEAGGGGVSVRPWSLQLLPLVIEPRDWAAIEAGVVQRAELLERTLADLYGPQTLLHQGLLPPALLLRHPGWLRPMIGVAPAGGQRLFIVAFDLARGPDGRWWLVSQRTQGPSGLGYVLHNRLVIARQFPEAFASMRVQRIASSYRLLLDALEQRAAQVAQDAAGRANPRIVLLTPGPYSETYFEHAYLARYLGLPLVEGGDLTVRGERLYLKTVEGLEPVHGVMRRLDDDWCDPLELRPDSALGVPGLLQAARAGTVVMANALGSAFLESPAVQGFLPGIAEKLLGEPLALPSLPTWWCGEAAAWSDVRDHLADKVVRSTFPRGGRTTQAFNLGQAYPPGSDGERAPVPVHEDPDAWTVQGRLRFSRAPIWGDGAVTPRPAMVRVYAIADGRPGQQRWHVLPGGMTRVARREDASISMQRGGTSLDTWVMTEGPVDAFSMLPQRLRVDDLAAHQRPVSSRTGENLFWLGRYTERTEQLVRLARSTLLLIDADAELAPPLRAALSQLAVRTGLAPVGVPTLSQSPRHFERALLSALTDTRTATSIAYNLQALERAAMALRERLAPEQWGLVRQMGESFTGALETLHGELPLPAQVLPALDRLALQLAAATGAQTDRMTRDHGWRLLTVGRLLERLQGLTTRLLAFLGPVPEGRDAEHPLGALGTVAGVELLLEQFDSLITFRARYQRHEDLLALTEVLVLDSSNPRAFAGVLRRLRTELSKLPGPAESHQPLLALLPPEGAGLTLARLRELENEDVSATAAALRELAAELLQAANTLADRIGERFFTLAQGQDQRIG